MKKINRERKKLSVLIPVFNEGVNLKMMIRFIESTLGKEDEILILYDFDEDDSVPVVKKLQTQYSNLRLVKNGYGRGVANAIKTGLNEAKGKYAFIMTADDSGPLI